MTPIETDEDVKSMFQCHITLSQLPTIEIYVRLVENLEEQPSHNENLEEQLTHNENLCYPTQFVQSHKYGMSQAIDEYGMSQAISVFRSFIPTHNADEIEEGIDFENKEECVLALQQWHIKCSLDFSMVKSENVRFVIKCRNSTCNFKCRVSLRKGNSRWRVGKSGGPHTCTTTSMSQDHTKLSSEMISKRIMELVNRDASLKVKVIIAHVAEKYIYIISNKKAWIAKCKAIESLYGNWETSYNDLPQWILVMKTYLPGTVIELQSLPVISNDGSHLGDQRIFHRLFWAFRPCIRGFAYCKPIVQVDGTWLYGKYRGTLLMAMAQDGNGNIFPIAFALVESETKEAWSFFLKNLRIHVTPQENLCLISDRHESIKSAHNNPENGWQYPPSSHVYCIRHIAQNFMREIKDKDLRKIVVNMGYALTKAKFNYYRGQIRRTNNEALSWIDNIPREKWARAFDGGQRWGHMTTNLAEAMNSVLKETRNLPITALVKSTYYRLGSLFGRRGYQWTKVLASGQVFTDNCNKRMAEEVIKANTHNVMQFDRERFYFMVQEKINHNDG
ncbi:uncharacterized protein LOC127131352 [Lathyrus oleraceus]|uniref:uncharacterized protein LOC127131352 n=1 Tax=Pisum sativum TaxID=3888 RepID=UPI0021D3C1BB|nr:uncharacterized protein LOC127131352 [Pisum sativum]